MKITILHMRYRPDLTGTGPLVAELASDLARQGEEVTVVTTFPHYGKTPTAGRYGGGLRSAREEEGVRVVRTRGFAFGSASVVGRSVDYGLYTLASAVSGAVERRPDVILAVAPPITVGISGWLLGSWRRAPMVFNAQDIWPDGLIAMGKLRSRVLQRTFHALERHVYRAARRVTVLSDGMKDNLVRKGVPAEKVAVIPNWVDVEAIRPVEKDNPFRKELGLEGKFVVLFAGNIGFAAGLESVLRAADRLRQERDLVFVIVGEGSAKRELLRQAQDLDLPNLRFVTSQEPERLSQMLGAADVSLVPLRSGMGALSVPSKTLAIMASARPVLAAVPLDSEVRRILEQAQCGTCVAPEDPDALAGEVARLRSGVEWLESLGANGRRYAAAHFGRAEMVERYRRLLQEVASDGRRS